MTQEAEARVNALLEKLWHQHKPTILERFALISEFTERVERGTLTSAQREDAASAAHKLAGSLGTFGMHEATELARQIETVFQKERLLLPQEKTQLRRDVDQLKILLAARA